MDVIPKEKLKKYQWYVGDGRNNDVAMWNGTNFLTIGKKFGHWVIKCEGTDCFFPHKEIEHNIPDITPWKTVDK